MSMELTAFGLSGNITSRSAIGRVAVDRNRIRNNLPTFALETRLKQRAGEFLMLRYMLRRRGKHMMSMSDVFNSNS